MHGFLPVRLFMLQHILISGVRVKILTLFLKNLDRQFYVRQIVRAVGTEINAVRRELDRLTKIKLLRRFNRGNRVFYEVRRDFPLFPELLALIYKESGLGAKIISKQKELGSISFAALTANFVYGRTPGESELDFIVVGTVELPALKKMVHEEEKRLGREVNYTVLSNQEFDFLKKRRDPFIVNTLAQSRVMLVGNEDKFRQL